jgi:hypothetical protein
MQNSSFLQRVGVRTVACASAVLAAGCSDGPTAPAFGPPFFYRTRTEFRQDIGAPASEVEVCALVDRRVTCATTGGNYDGQVTYTDFDLYWRVSRYEDSNGWSEVTWDSLPGGRSFIAKRTEYAPDGDMRLVMDCTRTRLRVDCTQSPVGAYPLHAAPTADSTFFDPSGLPSLSFRGSSKTEHRWSWVAGNTFHEIRRRTISEGDERLHECSRSGRVFECRNWVNGERTGPSPRYEYDRQGNLIKTSGLGVYTYTYAELR